MLIAITFVAACSVTIATDPFALPSRARLGLAMRRGWPGAVDIAARSAVVALVYAIFFAISWRPVYAAGGTVSTFVVFTLISRAKYEFIREPLVFSDIALVLLVFRHKEIFYSNWLNLVFWLAAFAYVFGASALFMVFEPSVLPGDWGFGAVVGMIALALAPGMLLFIAPVRQMMSRVSSALLGSSDLRQRTRRFGTLASVLFEFLAWLGIRPGLQVRPCAIATSVPGSSGKPLIVVWQSESFVDLRNHGVTSLSLPHLDRLRARAVAWGRMSSIFEGGYTQRTEFSVISGLAPDELGPDASYPYLNAAHYADAAWPMRLKRAGWTTHFLHPYDRTFFARATALPRLGFETLTMLDGFDHDPLHDGPYVSDLTLSKRVIQHCRLGGDEAGQFIFAASMENHGPWKPGRGSGENPVDIYSALLERSDAALGYLADELDRLGRPVWLVFYGDHAPVLKAFADPFPDPRTDYVIVPLAQASHHAERATEAVEKAPWSLLRDLVGHAGFGAEPTPSPETAR